MAFSTRDIPDKDVILNEVSELAVFRHYLGDVEPYEYIRNPLRPDNAPTAMIYEDNNGRLKFRDYSGYFWGDIFDLVQRQERCTFEEALSIIWNKYLNNELTNYKITALKRFHRVSDIYVQLREWNQADLDYWSKYHITKEVLKKFNVYPLGIIWFNHVYDSNIVYKYINQYDPAYGYYSGNNKWEIYYPSRDKGRKFQTNHHLTKGIIELEQVEGNELIITKSRKDIMVLYVLGYSSIAPPSETTLLSEDAYNHVNPRFKEKYTLFDYDNTGIHLTWRMRKKFNITNNLFLRERLWGRSLGYRGAKDISDLVDIHNLKFAKEWLDMEIQKMRM